MATTLYLTGYKNSGSISLVGNNNTSISQSIALAGSAIQAGPKGDKGDQGDPATNLVQSVNGKQGAVVLDATDVGADAAGSAATAQTNAENYADTAVSTLNNSLGTAAFNDTGDFATAVQGAKADSAIQAEADPTVPSWAKAPSKPTYNKAEVGLANVDNTSDANKPISTATQTALDTKATTTALNAHTSNTSNPHSVTKAQVGLGNVDNTSDADKPVSTDVQSALDGKVTINNTVQSLYGNSIGGSIPTMLLYTSAASSNTIAYRGPGAVLSVGNPTSSLHAATKGYVDSLTPIYGTGFPEGVVSASPGRIYIDTAITNGASSWIKKSGTGNTGWQVLEGDTGWRNIGNITGITERIKIRRVGPNVYFSQIGDSITINSVVTLSRLALPLGFRSSLRQVSELIATSGAKYGTMLVKSTEADLILTTTGTATFIAFGNGSFATDNAWPSTLPGTAV